MLVKKSQEIALQPVPDPAASGARYCPAITDKEGAPNFHMRLFELSPGGHTPHHAHPWEHEIFVKSGSGVLVTDQGEKPLSAGDMVYIPGNERHQFRNNAKQPFEFVCVVPAAGTCGCVPGKK